LKRKKAVTRAKSKKAATNAASGKGPGANDAALRKHLLDLLKGGSAHVQFMDALEEFPPNKRGTFAPGLPHTGWQLLEHSRIAQWDILEFSRNPKHVSPGFPEGYWPKTPGPPTEAEWEKSVESFQHDLEEMVGLVKNPRSDLFAKIRHGDGQTILRQALVLADHNAYHLGQLVDLRRALGTWPQP
jgi:DinB superfamily